MHASSSAHSYLLIHAQATLPARTLSLGLHQGSAHGEGHVEPERLGPGPLQSHVSQGGSFRPLPLDLKQPAHRVIVGAHTVM